MHSSITYNIFCTLAKCIVLKNTYKYSTCNNMFTFITCSLFVLHPPKCTCFVKNWDSYINAASISFILFKITKLKNVRLNIFILSSQKTKKLVWKISRCLLETSPFILTQIYCDSSKHVRCKRKIYFSSSSKYSCPVQRKQEVWSRNIVLKTTRKKYHNCSANITWIRHKPIDKFRRNPCYLIYEKQSAVFDKRD